MERKENKPSFRKHEKRCKGSKERVQAWKDALFQAANLSGWDSTKTGSGTSETRQEIHVPAVGFGEPGAPPIHPSGIIYPPVNPNWGSDVIPGPPAGVYHTRGYHGIGGGMLVGPNDPRWFGGEPPFPGGQPGVPPGARFDPYGPPDVPGFEPNRFARRSPRPGHDVHPDLQHFRRDADSYFI